MKMTTRTAGSGVLLALAILPLAGCGEESKAAPAGCVDRKVSGTICTVAGTGIAGDGADGLPSRETRLYLPQDVAVGPDGRLFVVDWNNHRIRSIENSGRMKIIAGVGELGADSDDPETNRLNHPTDIIFDAEGRLVIAAWHNSKIKIVDSLTGDLVDTCGNGKRGFAGDGGPALVATLDLPVGIVFDRDGGLVISDQANQRLRKVDVAGNINTIAGGGPCPGGGTAGTPCFSGDGGPALMARFNFPTGQAAAPAGRIAIDAQGNIYVADTGNHRVRRIDTAGIVTTFAGNGTRGFGGDGGNATDAQLNRLTDVAVAPDGRVYIADNANHCVRVVGSDGVISTAAGVCGQRGFAGDDGNATAALLDRPYGVTLDGEGNLYIADTHNHRVRVVFQ